MLALCLLLSSLFLAVVSFYFGIKQLHKTNTIPVYNCYSWFSSWLLLILILYACYLLFLLYLFLIVCVILDLMLVYISKHKKFWCRYNHYLLIYISNTIYFRRGFHRVYRIQWKCEILVPITVIFLKLFQLISW